MSQAPSLPDPDKLPKDPEVLQQMILALLGQLHEKDRRIETLSTWLAELRRHQFGRKTESLSDENQKLLGFLIEGVVARKLHPIVEPPPAPPAAPPKQERKGHGRAPIPKELPRDVVVHDVPEEKRRCKDCRKKLVPIGQESSERLEYVPASAHVIRDVRIKYACPDEECRGTILLADLPDRAAPRCKAAEGMLAFVVAGKIAWHLPLNRLVEILANHGVCVTRSTLWEWFSGAAYALEPIVKWMAKEVQSSDVVQTDETPVPLKDPELDRLRTARQWTYLNQEHTVYDFTSDRKREHPRAFLENTKGYVLSDAAPAYRSIAEELGTITNVFCWAHARRQFWKAIPTDRQRALVGMAYISALYKVEKEAKELSPTKRKQLRRRKSKPILGQMKAWLGEVGMEVLPRSPIGKAIAYVQNHWTELCRFLEDGRLRLDNNLSELQIRQVVIGRRNWGRYESERGGKVGAILESLVASCRRHKVNPFEYLRDVLRRIATHPAKRIGELTPARWKPKPPKSKPKSRPRRSKPDTS
jgi:transposase